MVIRIAATQYSLRTKSFEVYVSGCKGNPHCSGCHNPELWDFKIGSIYNEKYFSYLKNRIKQFDILVDNIMVMGGEPLDQDINSLIKFLKDLKTLNKQIWLFTRFELEEIPEEVLSLCDYVKTGRYLKDLQTDDNIQFGIELASSNQKIFKLAERDNI
jgi:anaerobic ribonucleoside-triphosphate reductase activating protein